MFSAFGVRGRASHHLSLLLLSTWKISVYLRFIWVTCRHRNNTHFVSGFSDKYFVRPFISSELKEGDLLPPIRSLAKDLRYTFWNDYGLSWWKRHREKYNHKTYNEFFKGGSADVFLGLPRLLSPSFAYMPLDLASPIFSWLVLHCTSADDHRVSRWRNLSKYLSNPFHRRNLALTCQKILHTPNYLVSSPSLAWSA